MLSKIQEDYIQAIAEIVGEKNYARVSDVSVKLAVKPASVTSMLQKLKKEGLVQYDKHAPVFLTDKGKETASRLQLSHALFEQFLITIGVPKHLAVKDALKIQHNVHPQTLERMKAFIDHCSYHKMTCSFHCQSAKKC
ncbi:MAG: metal-dependent transcriptional regulator [Candidatus Woesearchaeota archaeon]